MARGRSTTARTQAREAARQRKAVADAQRRDRDAIELDVATEYAIARTERDEADARAAEQVRRLDELPDTRTDRIATLLGETRSEITRLRKLAKPQPDDEDQAGEPAADSHPGADAAEPDAEPASASTSRSLSAPEPSATS